MTAPGALYWAASQEETWRWLHLVRYHVPLATETSADTNVFVLASA